MLMTTVDGKRVQELVNFMSLEQRQACKEKADGALIYFAATSFEGPLSKDEMLQAEEALEFLVRVEATELRRGWWYRFWRRHVLARYYFHGEALVAASRRMQEDQEWDFAFKALSAKERSKDPALQEAYDDAREALDQHRA